MSSVLLSSTLMCWMGSWNSKAALYVFIKCCAHSKWYLGMNLSQKRDFENFRQAVGEKHCFLPKYDWITESQEVFFKYRSDG